VPPADRRRGEIVFWSLVGGRWSLVGGPGLHVLGAFWGFGNSLLGTSIVDGEPGLRYKFETAIAFFKFTQPPLIVIKLMFLGD